jgi:hypothetical protein
LRRQRAAATLPLRTPTRLNICVCMYTYVCVHM